MKVPHGAERIVEVRKKGMRPADMVIVSMVGKLDELNPIVFASGQQEYDWRWVRGLEVMIFAKTGSPWRRLAEAISPHRPAKLGLWDVFRGEGAWIYRLPTIASLEAAKSSDDWKWELSFLPWTDWQNREFDK